MGKNIKCSMYDHKEANHNLAFFFNLISHITLKMEGYFTRILVLQEKRNLLTWFLASDGF